jgi:hypothetical protein
MGSYALPDWKAAGIWTALAWAANVFFFWAEYDDYRREKHNYEGWKEEMRYLQGEDLPKSWNQRMSMLRRPRE